ncbi:hypothetical protein XBJ2_1630015 [Xenorhabdus bovienii str. Jollieti]|uniref:Uncharacterized protein n=1 Tax=Xenorhabdus bovienii (strain SS-2004) TaxID=406818 RepID=D3V3M3_XENBS|nr:hypothetical protein XBJ1_3130 [Xenorhabdus bovienii SS-2004]CDH28106.1 hypothetical protein XBJ2_1630015 [Xenorhabdus bovienii str. Jollieti]
MIHLFLLGETSILWEALELDCMQVTCH